MFKEIHDNTMIDMFHDSEFRKLFDAKSDAYNSLSEKMGKDIGHQYVADLIETVEELEKYKCRFVLQKIYSMFKSII